MFNKRVWSCVLFCFFYDSKEMLFNYNFECVDRCCIISRRDSLTLLYTADGDDSVCHLEDCNITSLDFVRCFHHDALLFQFMCFFSCSAKRRAHLRMPM